MGRRVERNTDSKPYHVVRRPASTRLTRVTLKQLVRLLEAVAALAIVAFVVMLFAVGGKGTYESPGAQIFSANCARCHGADGGGGIGPKLAGKVRKDFPDADDQIALVTGGKRTMPAFGGDLTAAEIRQVVEYTRTELGR